MRLASPEQLSERRAGARVRGRWSSLLVGLALLAAAGLVGQRVWWMAMSGPTPAPGTAAPAWTAERLSGETLTLEDLRGQVVLLDFWATWCPPCVSALPSLSRLYGAFSDRGFVVVGINQEPGDEARVRAFASAHDLEFPIVVDPGRVALAYGVHRLPTSFLVDQQGVVRAAYQGLVSETRLRRAIEALLDADDAPP